MTKKMAPDIASCPLGGKLIPTENLWNNQSVVELRGTMRFAWFNPVSSWGGNWS